MEILNKSYKVTLEIKKDSVLGVVLVEPEHLTFKHESKKRHQKHRDTSRKWKKQRGSFLNRYAFAFAGRDTVNQVTKVAPEVIKAATNDINKVAEQRINQITSKEVPEMERVLPKILRGAIEDVYQTPFRLLGKFGKE